MFPDTSDSLVVSGHIDGEFTCGVTCLVEIIARAGNTGTLVFTPEPPVDVVQLGDPWLGSGIFTASDTLGTFSSTLNGSEQHNASMIPASLVYSGDLSGFPIVASADAGGVWDIALSTSSADSSWEGVGTTLVAGTVLVVPEPGTMSLLAIGAICPLVLRRRRA